MIQSLLFHMQHSLRIRHTLAEIAFQSGHGLITAITARDHVKNMHVKLGLQRPPDLIRLVLSLGSAPAFLPQPNNQMQAAGGA